MSELDNFNNSLDSSDSSLTQDLVASELKDVFNANTLSNSDAFIDPITQIAEISLSNYPDSEGQIIWSEKEVDTIDLEREAIDEQVIVNLQAAQENFESHKPESTILERSLALSNSKLEAFLNNSDALDHLHLAFGDDWNPTEALALVKDLITEKAIPEISLLPASTLQARGAFDGEKIYLAEELFDSQDPEEISNVFLEEFGHYLDSRINTTDSEGDEGEIFSRLVRRTADIRAK